MRQQVVALCLSLILNVVLVPAQTPPAPSPQGESGRTDTSTEPISQFKEAGVMAPRLTDSPDPEYPRRGRNGLREGTVVFQLVVGRDGLPRDIKIVRSVSPGFDQAAADAVKRWKFAPATKNGQAVSARIKVEVSIKGNY